jgi:hypothetical protein
MSSILKAQNEYLLERIADDYDLHHEDIRAKYLRPSFYMLDIKRENVAIEYTELKPRRATKIKAQNDDRGKDVSQPVDENPS